jgi:putative membrane protein
LRFEDVFRNWSGPALALVGVTATIWLAATGTLTLYVHPRYTLLTVIMAVLTLLVLLLMAVMGSSSA